MSSGEEVCARVSKLIDGWCERRALKPLAIVLPDWPPFGHTDQWFALRQALQSARASGALTAEEVEKVGEILGMLDSMLSWSPRL